jgi:hypothetical protein
MTTILLILTLLTGTLYDSTHVEQDGSVRLQEKKN